MTTTFTPSSLLLEKLQGNDPFTTWITLSRPSIPATALTDALRKNRHVTKISCHAPFLATLSLHDIAQLVQAFGDMPQLQEVWMALPSNRSNISQTVVRALLLPHRSSQNLQKLTLRGVNAPGCLAMAQALSGTNTKLQELHLYGSSSRESRRALLTMLEHNTSLQQVVLRIGDPNDNATCRQVAQLLRTNTTLIKLDLALQESSRNGIRTISANNRRSLHRSHSNNSQGCEDIVQVLAQGDNVTLCQLELNMDAQLQTALAFYLKRNRSQLPQLLRDSRADWLEFVATNSNDLSLIYHAMTTAPQCLESLVTSEVPVVPNKEPPLAIKNVSPTPSTQDSPYAKKRQILRSTTRGRQLLQEAMQLPMQQQQEKTASIFPSSPSTSCNNTPPKQPRMKNKVELCLTQTAFIPMPTTASPPVLSSLCSQSPRRSMRKALSMQNVHNSSNKPSLLKAHQSQSMRSLFPSTLISVKQTELTSNTAAVQATKAPASLRSRTIYQSQSLRNVHNRPLPMSLQTHRSQSLRCIPESIQEPATTTRTTRDKLELSYEQSAFVKPLPFLCQQKEPTLCRASFRTPRSPNSRPSLVRQRAQFFDKPHLYQGGGGRGGHRVS